MSMDEKYDATFQARNKLNESRKVLKLINNLV
jgi:hypothetical protein